MYESDSDYVCMICSLSASASIIICIGGRFKMVFTTAIGVPPVIQRHARPFNLVNSVIVRPHTVFSIIYGIIRIYSQ